MEPTGSAPSSVNPSSAAPAAEGAARDQGVFPLEPQRLTWAVLLGRWIDFARSSVALPMVGDGRRIRDSIADVIALQAVWFALKNLGDLPDDERALGLDRAEVLIEKHSQELRQRWKKEMPQTMAELIVDAAKMLAASRAVSGPTKDECES